MKITPAEILFACIVAFIAIPLLWVSKHPWRDAIPKPKRPAFKWSGMALAFISLLLPGCSQYQALTGQSAAQVAAINSTAEQQTLTALYNGAASATTQSIGALSNGNEQNGQDVIQGLWIGALESAGVTALGDYAVDYGGPVLTSLKNYINTKLTSLPASLQPAAKATIAAAVQNTVNASATESAIPSSMYDNSAVSVP